MGFRPYHDLIAQWIGRLTQIVESYRRENEALRQMLRAKGLTKMQIQRESKKRAKYPHAHEEASALFHRVCEEMTAILQENDPLDKIAKSLPKTDKKDAN
jgi:hypothetical protein